MSHTENLIESVRGDKAAMERELQAAWYRLQNAEDGASGDDAAFILACADELGAPYAQLLASHMALEGIGMEADSGAARDWLEKACAADFPLALVQLGRFLTIEGSGRDDEAKARECFGRALEIDAPEARAALGESLVLGGLGSDHVEDGARLLRAAAEDDPECAMLLARFIEEGKIQPAEGENTFLLIARAAEGGVPEAMRDLGNILLVYSLAKPEGMPLPGLTPEACREEAVRWLSMAADAGDEKAGLILKGVEARQAESGSPDGEVRQ